MAVAPVVGAGLLILALLLAGWGWRLAWWGPLGLAALVLLGSPWWPRGPELVEDRVGLLADAERERLSDYHALLRADHGIDYRVVIGRELGDLDRFAVDHFRRHELGAGGDAGRGLLLVLDVAANEVRLEVGHGLEAVFVDAFVAYVEARQMTEFFAVGRVADGILASTELIVAQAETAEGEVLPALAGSGGAGARMPARLGEGAMAADEAQVAIGDGATPHDVLAAYRRAMQQRNDNPELVIYGRETRRMLADWVMTPAQMDNMARSLAGCPVARELTAADARRVVLLAPLAERRCPPYFFVREGGAWRLDLAGMMQAVRFGRDNRWRLEVGALGPYGFGFEGIALDANGYPVVP
ncbi:TPM domain-containing protein [Halomonas kalidii]|uniref:TPM domain-containing protein n=1 Tax=Halomonas kalidii TaxID=3043293 RepID=A0ABT6VF66_9GAMM|nr:TPM domain-containing protein [Halomonas kalidii]MDI5932623.1 TPM domain-containing protein [Halomonas kalidii]